jgi:hypothetical protein
MGKDHSTDIILLDDILEARRTIVVELEVGENKKEIPITYNPSKFTPELEAKINADSSDNLGDSFLLLLEPLFVDWGIKLPPKKEGDPPIDFPPTKENLAKMPFQILSLFIKAIMEDIVPKKANTRR